MAQVPENSFGKPIKALICQLKDTDFSFPFLPQIIKIIVISLVILVLFSLYVTIGILSQVSSVLLELMGETSKNISGDSFLNASAYAVAYAIYAILFMPLFIILSPFLLIGLMFKKYKKTLIFFVILAIITYIVYSNFNLVKYTIWNVRSILNL